MTQRIKLLLLIPHLGGGGAEQVTAHLSNHLDRNRFSIDLVLITPDRPGSRQAPDWVKVHRFNALRVRRAWLRILYLIRRRRPHVILSNMAHLNFLVLSLKPFLPANTRILVRQNTTASASARTGMSRFLYRYLYPKADAIVCQSQSMADDLAEHFGIDPRKLAILHNPIDRTGIRLASGSASQPSQWTANAWPRLLAVGRLAWEKGFDLLLESLLIVRRVYPAIKLTILGAGPEEQSIRTLSHELGIADAIGLPGYISNLSAYYSRATLFVLSSRLEGMPNALLEAAAAGLPLVATPCCAGLCELLQDAAGPCPGSWLATEVSAEALAETILQALSTLPQPPKPPQRFDHFFLAPFESTTAVAAYQSLIESVVTQANP